MPKDAKGHGSNPRGGPQGPAHQVGVNSVGKAPPPVTKTALDTIRQNPGGFSVTPGGRQPTGGFMVSIPGRTQLLDEADLAGPRAAEIVNQFTSKNADAFGNNPNMHIGGWTSGGKVYLDPSENIHDREAAIAAGRQRNQIAIWDVANQKEIPTGGTGK